MDASLRLYSLAGAAAVVAGAAAFYISKKRQKTPAQKEFERRDRLNLTGRIIDGTVIDVLELPAPPASKGQSQAGPSQLLVYQYDVAGVQYEASQDVTYLRQFVDLHSCRLGLPASVKYDPQNPGNSIVICETWTGLHSGTPLILGIQQMALEHARKKAEALSEPEPKPVPGS